MILEHRGKRPRIHASAYVAPNATLCGDVTIGAESRVLFGAVLTAESGPVTLGERCIIMENAVIRGVAHHPASLGDLDFARTVFGDQPAARGETRMPERSLRYTRALGAHKDDRIVEP